MKLSVALKKRNAKIEEGLAEELRPTSVYQDAFRLCCSILHLYFYILIIKFLGFTIRLLFLLTIETFTVNTTYFLLTTINSLINKLYNNKEKNFYIVKQCNLNTLYRLGFTASVVVTIMYWGIYMHNPNMLGENELPMYFDFFIHGGTLIIMTIDRIIIDRNHRYEARIKSRTLFYITIFYFIMIYSVYIFSGLAVYPLIAKLTFIQLIILSIVGYSLFLIGNFIYLLLM